MDRETALAKAKALLAKAERTDSEPEANAYNAKAMGILAKYGIDVALTYEEDWGSDKVINLFIDIAMPFGKEKCYLLFLVARAFGCTAIRLTKKAPHRMHLFGFESDVTRVQMVYQSLAIQALRFLSQDIRDFGIPVTDKRGAYERAWLSGYSTRVSDRLTAINRKAERESAEAGKSTDLVLLDRSVVVQNEVSTAYPKLIERKRTLNGSGYRDGVKAGNRADIGQTRVGGQRKAIA